MLMADRERLQERRQRLSSETWVETVLNFGRWFHRAAGRVDSLAADAARRGRRWLQGVSHSRAAFAQGFVIASLQLLDESWPAVRGQSPKGIGRPASLAVRGLLHHKPDLHRPLLAASFQLTLWVQTGLDSDRFSFTIMTS